MALMQRYTTEVSSHVGSSQQMRHGGNNSLDKLGNELASIQRHDDDEKRYLHSLNDRLENLLGYLDNLELTNKKLTNDLNSLILNWGLTGDLGRFLKELEGLTRHLSEENRRKVLLYAETKLLHGQTELTDRVSGVFVDVRNSYRDQTQLFDDLTRQLEEEFRQIQHRLSISSSLVKSLDDDYQKELSKCRTYLGEWSQIALDKQHLLNEIQSLKERYNLRLAYNQEEINEWKRLLARIAQESKNFYRDYLETIKQQIQMDYQQMAKDQQMNIELEMKTRMKEIEEQISLGTMTDGTDERHRRDELQRFETRLSDNAKENERLQNQYRTLAEENQRKRRNLQDLENEARNKARQNVEQNARLRQSTELTRTEYQTLRDQLDQLVHRLKFSIEEELKIYETLLNSLHRQKDTRPSLGYGTTTATTTTSTKTSLMDDSKDYRPLAPLLEKPSTTSDADVYGIQQNLLDRNQRRTTTTTRTTRRFGQESNDQQKISMNINRTEQQLPELDENYMQSKIHITRKYKGNVLIKFVDVGGRFVEIENTGNQARDLTGWYIERSVDGRRINYRFPSFQLDGHRSVRIYGSQHKKTTSFSLEDEHLELIAANFSDWGIGRKMQTELFNRSDVGKALFEQTIKD